MVNSTRAAALGAIAAVMLVSACALAPTQPDEGVREGALQRWNRCLKRFDTNLEHYCDGHRRDVLATYPPHRQYRINTLLIKKTRAISRARSLKTAFDKLPAEQ